MSLKAYEKKTKNLDLERIVKKGGYGEYFDICEVDYLVALPINQRQKLFKNKANMEKAAEIISKYIKSEIKAEKVKLEYDYRDDFDNDTDLPSFDSVNPSIYKKTLNTTIYSDKMVKEVSIPLVASHIALLNSKNYDGIMIFIEANRLELCSELDLDILEKVKKNLQEEGIKPDRGL